MFKMWYWVLTCCGDLDLFEYDLGKYLFVKPRKNATWRMIGPNFLQWYDKNSINDTLISNWNCVKSQGDISSLKWKFYDYELILYYFVIFVSYLNQLSFGSLPWIKLMLI